MKKWQIKNLEKSEISEISEKLFRVFSFPSFRFCPTAKIENSDLKISEKISEISEVSEFSTWPFSGVLIRKVWPSKSKAFSMSVVTKYPFTFMFFVTLSKSEISLPDLLIHLCPA